MALGGSGSGVVGALASPFQHSGENESIGLVNHGSYGAREFYMGGMMAPQNVFEHCAQTLRRRKLKPGDF